MTAAISNEQIRRTLRTGTCDRIPEWAMPEALGRPVRVTSVPRLLTAMEAMDRMVVTRGRLLSVPGDGLLLTVATSDTIWSYILREGHDPQLAGTELLRELTAVDGLAVTAWQIDLIGIEADARKPTTLTLSSSPDRPRWIDAQFCCLDTLTEITYPPLPSTDPVVLRDAVASIG